MACFNKRRKAGALLWALAVTACTTDAEKLNALNPDSKEYQQELARIINQHGDKLTVTFNKYVKVGGKDYIEVSIDGRGGIHANSMVLVNNWTKLEGIKRTKGVGYSGAKLKNLKVSVINADTKPVFVFKDLGQIND